ncbi:GPI transamidase component family protein / Gaa1-like family protein [Euphorbia peplus]|nr:GPI transamidase component family protein / Gaa1-like family protein [Euphorbia peplus]
MDETKVEMDTPKVKPRPIVRIGIFLISRSLIVSVVCCMAGVLALFLLPVLAKNTYISENALMPGSASSMLSSYDISEANRLVKDLSRFNPGSDDSGIESRELLAMYMSDLGAEVSHHKFLPQPSQFHPLQFFSSPDSRIIGENISCSSYGINTIGIIRAPRGDGKEAIVLVTPYNFSNSDLNETLSLSIAYSVFSLLTRVTWLAKDIVWLVADSKYGEHASVASWLRDYHNPSFSGLDSLHVDMCENIYVLKEKSDLQRKLSYDFRRAGTMAAALVVKVTDRNELWDDTLHIYAEASNGQMPNLDLINIVNYLAVHRQGFHVKVQKFWSLIDKKFLEVLGNTFELLGKLARSLNPDWKFGIPAAEYIEGTATLASSLYHQALGIPTGPHGAFRDFQVDAITLEISPKVSSNKARRNEFILQGGRLIEGVIRSVNNLLEKFHQSFFLYLLTSPSKFVSVGVYMIAFALLVAPLPLVAASLYADANGLDIGIKTDQCSPSEPTLSDELNISFKTWKWLKAAKEVFLVHAWGLVVSLLPHYICQIPDRSPTTSLVTWVLFSMFSLVILYVVLGYQISPASESRKGEWAMLKSVTISAVFIGLLLMSVVNFATAEIGAMLMVPTCLMAQPLKLDIRAASLKSYLRVICNLVLVFIAFPPVAFSLSKIMFEDADSINVGDLWNWVESLWAWNSATYIYIGMVHLPCWVLCLHILLHSC